MTGYSVLSHGALILDADYCPGVGQWLTKWLQRRDGIMVIEQLDL